MCFYLEIFLILGDPGATSRDDAIFSGESLLQELHKLSPKNIASSRLVAPGSPRMDFSLLLSLLLLISYLF